MCRCSCRLPPTQLASHAPHAACLIYNLSFIHSTSHTAFLPCSMLLMQPSSHAACLIYNLSFIHSTSYTTSLPCSMLLMQHSSHAACLPQSQNLPVLLLYYYLEFVSPYLLLYNIQELVFIRSHALSKQGKIMSTCCYLLCH